VCRLTGVAACERLTRDQEVSRLFNECKWTQEKIAQRMGHKQAWVQKRLCFGIFMAWIKINPSGINPKFTPHLLTERTFRKHWQKVGKGDRKEGDEGRFARVLESLVGSPPEAPPPGKFVTVIIWLTMTVTRCRLG